MRHHDLAAISVDSNEDVGTAAETLAAVQNRGRFVLSCPCESSLFPSLPSQHPSMK